MIPVGTMKFKVTEQASNEVRCLYRTEVPFVCRNLDINSWVDYITCQLPDSYEGEVGDKISDGTTQMYLRYTAASANANDIVRRLRRAELYFVPEPGNREKLCGCPSGTLRCFKRDNK